MKWQERKKQDRTKHKIINLNSYYCYVLGVWKNIQTISIISKLLKGAIYEGKSARFHDIFNRSDVRVKNPNNDSKMFGLNFTGNTGAIFSDREH